MRVLRSDQKPSVQYLPVLVPDIRITRIRPTLVINPFLTYSLCLVIHYEIHLPADQQSPLLRRSQIYRQAAGRLDRFGHDLSAVLGPA